MAGKKIKSWPMTREQSSIAAAVFVSFFVLWFLWAAVGSLVICWIEDHPGMASWVQAIGSIAAFSIAVTVYIDSIKKRKRDDLLNENKHILWILRILKIIKRDFDDVPLNESVYAVRIKSSDFYIASLENEASKMLHEEISGDLIEFISTFSVYIDVVKKHEKFLFKGISLNNDKEIVRLEMRKYKNTFMPYCNDLIEKFEIIYKENNE